MTPLIPIGRKVAILSTSDIFRRDRNGNAESTGLLEHAQDVMKLRVIVVSTREKLFEQDTWWIVRLDKEDIYMSPPVQESFSKFGVETYDVAYRRSYRRAWLPLLTKLGWEYPPCEFDPENKKDHNLMPFWAAHNLKTLTIHDVRRHYNRWLEDHMKYHIEVRPTDDYINPKYIRFDSLHDMVHGDKGLDTCALSYENADINVFVRNEVTVEVISKDGEGGATHTRETFEIKTGHQWIGAKEYSKFCQELADFFDSEILSRYNTPKHWSETISVTAMTDIDDELFCTTVVTILENTSTSHTELQ